MIYSPICARIKRLVHGKVQSTLSAGWMRHKNRRRRTHSSPVPDVLDGMDKRCTWKEAVMPSGMNDSRAAVPKCGPSLYLFHPAGGRVPSMKMGLNLQYSVAFWKAGWNTRRDSMGSQHWVLSCLKKTCHIHCTICLNPNIWAWSGLLLLFCTLNSSFLWILFSNLLKRVHFVQPLLA